jgi:hypothetical protein
MGTGNVNMILAGSEPRILKANNAFSLHNTKIKISGEVNDGSLSVLEGGGTYTKEMAS